MCIYVYTCSQFICFKCIHDMQVVETIVGPPYANRAEEGARPGRID